MIGLIEAQRNAPWMIIPRIVLARGHAGELERRTFKVPSMAAAHWRKWSPETVSCSQIESENDVGGSQKAGQNIG